MEKKSIPIVWLRRELIDLMYDEGVSEKAVKAVWHLIDKWENKKEVIETGMSRGLFQCFNCLGNSVVWDNDFTFEDYGREDEGIVHVLHCTQRGAEIEYYVPLEEEEGLEK